MSTTDRFRPESMSSGDEAGRLRAELGRLCRGRGATSVDLRARLGPEIDELLRIHRRNVSRSPTDAAERSPRSDLTTLLAAGVARLPADLRLVAAAALGLEPSAQGRFLIDRIGWLTGRIGRDERTVRRRLGEALALLAEALLVLRDEALAPAGPPDPPSDPGTARPARDAPDAQDARDPWYLRQMRSLVRLDLPQPEVYEERVVVATRDGLESVVLSASLPRPGSQAVGGRELHADVLSGGLLTARERPSESLFRFVVTLPRPLAAGADHRLTVRLTLAPGQAMADYYGLTPLTRCDEFQLRLRFSPASPPSGVWLLDGVPPRIADDDPSGLPAVELDRVGECLLTFPAPRLGRSHGARWQL